MRALDRLEKEASQEYQDAIKHWEANDLVAKEEKKILKDEIKSAIRKKSDPKMLAMAALSEDEVAAPTQRRYRVNDSTVEKLGELLAGNPTGILLYRDELVGFLRSLDKQGQKGSRAFFLEEWKWPVHL